jgi:hypothetical protein
MGMRGGPGMAGGPAGGMPGGPPGMGMRGGPGPAGGGDNPPPAVGDADDNASMIIAVVEIENASAGTGDKYLKRFEEKLPIKVRHRWGGIVQLLKETEVSRTVILKQTKSGKPLPSVNQLYWVKFKEIMTANPDKEQVLELAEWCLTHGLTGKCAEALDKYAELDKKSEIATAYLQIKAELQRAPAREDEAAWRAKLLPRYKVAARDGAHYVIYYDSITEAESEVKSHLDMLEENFRGFYYWWVLRGKKALPVPRQREVVVLTNTLEEFKRLQHGLSGGGVVADGFFAPRENLAVISKRRLDNTFGALEEFGKPYWVLGFDPDAMLTGRGKGLPREAQPQDADNARMIALVRKALRVEQELGAISHDASRQLLYASGLLPRHVAVPEWILFGMGSLFETPPESPWPGVGAPSFYWLPRFREMRGTKFEGVPAATLHRVVTDSYFRFIPPGGASEVAQKAHDGAERKARAAAWALTYYLARERLDGLEKYFKELAKMPRDKQLDDAALLGCFARAFNVADSTGRPDPQKLSDLANLWYKYMDALTLETEEMRQEIRRFHLETIQQEKEKEQPAANPGARPPGR